MVTFMNEAQSAVEELRMFLEVDSLDEMKKKLDKYYGDYPSRRTSRL